MSKTAASCVWRKPPTHTPSQLPDFKIRQRKRKTQLFCSYKSYCSFLLFKIFGTERNKRSRVIDLIGLVVVLWWRFSEPSDGFYKDEKQKKGYKILISFLFLIPGFWTRPDSVQFGVHRELLLPWQPTTSVAEKPASERTASCDLWPQVGIFFRSCGAFKNK